MAAANVEFKQLTETFEQFRHFFQKRDYIMGRVLLVKFGRRFEVRGQALSLELLLILEIAFSYEFCDLLF